MRVAVSRKLRTYCRRGRGGGCGSDLLETTFRAILRISFEVQVERVVAALIAADCCGIVAIRCKSVVEQPPPKSYLYLCPKLKRTTDSVS